VVGTLAKRERKAKKKKKNHQRTPSSLG